MNNYHSRRIFTVGSPARGCDFATLASAFTELAAVGGWSAANRALLIVEQVTADAGNINAVPFVDVHILEGAAIGNAPNAVTITLLANYDGAWSGASNAQVNLNGNFSSTANPVTLNCFNLNMATVAANPFNFSSGATVLSGAIFNCITTSTGAGTFTLTANAPNFLVFNSRFGATTEGAAYVSGTFFNVEFTYTVLGVNAHRIAVAPGSRLVSDFCRFACNSSTPGGLVQLLGTGSHIIRNSYLQTLAGNLVLYSSVALGTGTRILNNVIKAPAGNIAVDALVPNVGIRCHNNGVRGTFTANWGNQAMALNGSNVIVT